jgi:predicted GIY-YIG superfamily endonuclease
VLYLLHFDRPLAHAQHYLGFTEDLETRLRLHANPNGSSNHRLMQVIYELGIGFTLARAWSGDRSAERKLKQRHEGRRLCPLCNPRALWRASAGCLDLEGKQLQLFATRAGVRVSGFSVPTTTSRRAPVSVVTVPRSRRKEKARAS